MCGVYGAGSSCRYGARRGACPVGRRFYLPFRHPAGGLPSLSPVYPAFCLLSCPHPPTRARRALFPAGRGRFLLSYARGFAPCIPRGWRGAALVRRALAAPGGGLPGCCRITLPFRCPAGGLPSLSPVYRAFCFLSRPIPPPPSPAGKGETLSLFCRGLPPPAPRHQTAYGTDSPCRSGTKRGRAFLVTR